MTLYLLKEVINCVHWLSSDLCLMVKEENSKRNKLVWQIQTPGRQKLHEARRMHSAVHGHSAFYKWYFHVIYLLSFILIFATMAYSKSTWNSRVKKVFYLFFVSVLSISRNAFFVPREAFVVLKFVFTTPVCYVSNFLHLRSVRSVVLNEPQQTRPSAITTYANIPRWYRFLQFFLWFISFILDRKRTIPLLVRQTSSPSPPTRYLKTLHTDNLY